MQKLITAALSMRLLNLGPIGDLTNTEALTLIITSGDHDQYDQYDAYDQ